MKTRRDLMKLLGGVAIAPITYKMSGFSSDEQVASIKIRGSEITLPDNHDVGDEYRFEPIYKDDEFEISYDGTIWQRQEPYEYGDTVAFRSNGSGWVQIG